MLILNDLKRNSQEKFYHQNPTISPKINQRMQKEIEILTLTVYIS